ncbi:FAD-binding protein [Halieaceae bacterium IMCC14734]|uniref:FAD-binding protein n=1 Tax=Candidatus Litorirhabdus singularis TaxID=2518993 RepID=A0ABT3TD38_9GAMM|nr:FAD-binding protein [Candidatus Litorirhabdus singularis]MCX2980213.1 FAD-binding protein [Candidatus Litorirhabdus singularis]
MTDYQTIQAKSVNQWHASSDVIVVGFGAAGSCAAIEAAAAGAKVLVLERASGISGTTCMATGHFYLGGGTRPQLANGLEDTVEDMFNYLVANTPEPDLNKIRLYCEQSVEHFNWLVDHGVPFNDGFYRRKHYEQPTDECLIWSGNEKAWPFSQQAKPVARGHKVENVGSEGGGLVMRKLNEAAQQLQVEFQFDARVTNLVSDEQGHISGVRYTHFGEERFVAARNGVVLAAGGFAMNQSMLEQYCPKLAHPGVVKQGNPNDDGAAINMGLAAGGYATHMEGALITAPFYPPESLLKGILVNSHGQRFINEDSYHARTMTACLDQPNGIAYLITDNACFGRPEIQMQELIDAWEDIATMEQGLGLPAGSLQQTLADYNAHAAEGKDPTFHKHSDWLQPLIEAPYAALQCSLGESVYVGFTLGGLRVSAQGEVMTEAGDAIIGLYAAGACASNIAQDGAGYSSGTAIGESTFFGRRAGRHVASGSC